MPDRPTLLISARSFGKVVPEPLQRLREAGLDVREFREGPDLDEPGLRAALREAAAWIVSFHPVTAELLDTAPSLRVIVKHGVGLDNIDLPAATARSIQVRTAPGGTEHAVPEHTLGLLFGLARRLTEANEHVKSGQWGGKFVGTGIHGRTLGIVGLGRIGGNLAIKVSGLGMRVLGYDPVAGDLPPALSHVERCDWETLLTHSDFIAVCAPLTEATRHLLGKEAFARVKPGVLLVNAARGGIVDEDALVEALEDGCVGGYGADVFSEEPPRNARLIGRANVICTPHMASYSSDSLALMGHRAADGVLHGLAGEVGEFLINREVLQTS